MRNLGRGCPSVRQNRRLARELGAQGGSRFVMKAAIIRIRHSNSTTFPMCWDVQAGFVESLLTLTNFEGIDMSEYKSTMSI